MRATAILSLYKRITIPRLSPTHTSARIIKFLTHNSDSVTSYDPVMILQCSSDLIADPADRNHPDEKLLMFIEGCEEGVVSDLNDYNNEWLDVGTPVGMTVDDDDDDDDDLNGDWIWQAYRHDDEEEINSI